MNQKDIREIIESAVNVDLSSKSRKVDLVDLKAIYCRICREFGFDYFGNKLNLEDISEEIGLTHATAIYHSKHRWVKAYNKNVVCRNIYDSFKREVSSENLEIKKSFEEPPYKKLYIELKKQVVYDDSLRKKKTRLDFLIEDLDDDKLGLLEHRLRPIIKMLNSAQFEE